jgi:fatty acid desaturase
MAFIKAVFTALLAGVFTVLVFFSSAIIFVVTSVGSLTLLIVGIFVGAWYLLWESQQDRDQRKNK